MKLLYLSNDVVISSFATVLVHVVTVLVRGLSLSSVERLRYEWIIMIGIFS